MSNVIISEEEYNDLKKDRNNWRDWYYELRYALRKDEVLDESISCARDIPSDVEMIEDLKKRAADGDYYKELSELLKEKLKKANKLADSWKRDYEFVRDQLIHPIYDILYPDNPNRDINVTDFINNVKDLKVYSEENGTMYKEIQEWREKCIARGDEISKLQNIMTEKDVEIKRLKKDNVYLNQNNALADVIFEKNTKLIQTISDQEITIKALLITIKEMCKEDETNE